MMAKVKKKSIVKKARTETKPLCPFYLKPGMRCVLVPEIRDYDTCGRLPCTVETAVRVSRPREG